MTSNESNNHDDFYVDGIHLGIREPNLIVLPIPENRYNSNSFVDINVYLINNTPNPFHLNPNETLITELLTLDGQTLPGEIAPDELVYRGQENIHSQSSFGLRLSQFISNLIHWFLRIQKRTFEPRLVNSRQGRTVTLTLKLFWKSNLLQFQVTNSPSYSPIIFSLLDKSWSFKALQPSTYQLRFLWGIPPSESEFSSDSETTQEISIGQLATQFVNFALIEPTGADNSAVEVDSIRFETLIPERVLTLPEKKRGIKTLVQIGIRITNNTPTPVRFSFFNTLIPEVVGADGQVCFGGCFRRVTKRPLVSDFPLVMPGENVLITPNASLFWLKNEQFALKIAAGDGGYWRFDTFKVGIYQIQLIYNNKYATQEIYDQEGLNTNLIENLWTGMVSTPKVEFRIVQS